MKILMVCLGNICRSPLAEGVMQHLSDDQHLGWMVDSAGTGGWHVGEAPDRRSIPRESPIDKDEHPVFAVSYLGLQKIPTHFILMIPHE